MAVNYACFTFLSMVDNSIGDISVAEEQQAIHKQQSTLTRIRHFETDDEALLKMNFRIGELLQILDLFGLPTWSTTHEGYKLHREEMLIYFLRCMKTGSGHAHHMEVNIHYFPRLPRASVVHATLP
jgi:hypothetical protein